MERSVPLLLELWREACRHIEIEQSLERSAPILQRSLPLDSIAVRRIDLARASVETLATVQCRTGPAASSARSELSATELQGLLAWCRRGEVEHASAETLRKRLPGAIEIGLEGDCLVGPLAAEEGPLGVVVLVA